MIRPVIISLGLALSALCAHAQFIGGVPKSEQRVVALKGAGLRVEMDLKKFTESSSGPTEDAYGAVIGCFVCDEQAKTLNSPMKLTISVEDLPKDVTTLSGWCSFVAPQLQSRASKGVRQSRLEDEKGVIGSFFRFREARLDWCADHQYFFAVSEGKIITLHFICEARTPADLDAADRMALNSLEVSQTLAVSSQAN